MARRTVRSTRGLNAWWLKIDGLWLALPALKLQALVYDSLPPRKVSPGKQCWKCTVAGVSEKCFTPIRFWRRIHFCGESSNVKACKVFDVVAFPN